MTINENESFDVTLIDANHCAGAVMFLFEGEFGSVLVTGDFRYKPSMFVDTPLKDVLVDICYFDNTYFNPMYSNIPSQENAFKCIVTLIEKKSTENTVFGIKMNKVGKEDLLVKLCDYFDTQIAVSKTRFTRYTRALQLDKKYFVTELESSTKFFVQDDENNFANELLNKDKIYINPSALQMPTHRLNIKEQLNSYIKSKSNKFQIPYSEHSSYNEIIEFVRKLRPIKIEPIVLDPNFTDMTRLTPYLEEEEVEEQQQPERREFSCEDCQKWWWDYKECSVCYKCKHKYAPVPYDEEFGICFFQCECLNKFVGFASKKIHSKCYKCNRSILPVQVEEKEQIERKTKKSHSCEKCEGKLKGKCPIYGKVLFPSSRLD